MTRADFLVQTGAAAVAVYAGCTSGIQSSHLRHPLPPAGPRDTLIIAHRGASAAAPENSLEALELAIDAGADMAEFDVRRTADESLVVFHDASVSGIPVGRLTRSELTTLTGNTPPLLAEVLDLLQGRIRLDVELKEAGYVDRVVSQLLDYLRPEDMIVTSFLDQVLVRVKEITNVETGLVLTAETPRAPMVGDFGSLFPEARLRRCGADYVVPEFELAHVGVVARTAVMRRPTLVWTVNDRRSLIDCLVDEQIAGVITDVPARARSLRDRLGVTGPSAR
jgi:glycerophosphoryl diester phosphodiesterase